MKLLTYKVIRGCEGRGDGELPYMTRLSLDLNRFKINLHIFHRSDHDEFHDHPWSFRTFILWGGYREHTPDGINLLRPFTLHYQPATWKHWVELLPGKKAVTLVFIGRYERQWGLWTSEGFENWRDYFKRMGC